MQPLVLHIFILLFLHFKISVYHEAAKFVVFFNEELQLEKLKILPAALKNLPIPQQLIVAVHEVHRRNLGFSNVEQHRQMNAFANGTFEL